MLNVRLFCIYTISLVFLALLFWQKSNHFNLLAYRKTPYFITKKRIELRKNFKNKQMAELVMAYVTGDKKRLKRKYKHLHKRLGIYHLFTPSGIHLSALFTLFLPLLFLLRKKNTILYFLASILAVLPLFLLPGFYSIKRLSIMRILKLVFEFFKLRVEIFHVFLISFLIDLIAGTGRISPIGFTYSFLFLGIILSQGKNPKFLFPFTLFGGQILINYFSNSTLTLAGPFLGFFATFIFTFLFPVIFLFFWTTPLFPPQFAESILSFFHAIIQKMDSVAIISGYFHSSLPLILLFVIFFALPHNKFKLSAISTLLFLHSEPILNIATRHF
ncbi:MAG: ComEC/Rec2 family competence protein [Bacteriovoracaceae bacterium]|nr:ComEC/Rec2 family competence protein [Bacteriovoracaceae bacterium]